MRKKFQIINISLALVILSSILLQSAHALEHMAAEFTQEKCVHSYETGKFQITHQHHNFDHCFTCEFSFSNFISPETYVLRVFSTHQEIPYFFTASETPVSFSGCAYSLRGPPSFIA